MAKTLRKKNFKIQMLAGNNLKSFPNANFQKTVTLVLTLKVRTNYTGFTRCKIPSSSRYCDLCERSCGGRHVKI